jgi:EmrB/QacA subfamily drug resistance transporter
MGRSKGALALIVLCAAQLMLIVDVVVLNVALPSMQRGLGIPAGQLQLTGVAYTLAFGSLLIVAGRAGDLFGRRRLFLIGLGVFTAASVLTAAAQDDSWLFAGRALQGLGAAMVSPTALALLTSTFAEGPERNRALGMWAAVGSGGAVAGQFLGGLMTDVFGWRSVFLINAPIGVLAIALATRLLPESHGQRKERLDLRGAALLSGGVAAFSLALARVAEHGFDAPTLAGTAVAVALLAGFALAERHHPAPLVRADLLRNRGVRSGNIVLALLAGATGSALFFTTLYLQSVLDYTPMAVGAAFAPVTLIVLAVSPVVGRLTSRLGARTLLLAGTTLTLTGMLLLSRVDPSGSYFTEVLPGLAVVAFGNALAFAPTMIAATSGVDAEDQGLASGLLNTSQELGTAVTLAVLAPIAATVARAGGLTGDAMATTAGYRAGFLAAAALLGLAAATAWRTPRGIGEMAPTQNPAPPPQPELAGCDTTKA